MKKLLLLIVLLLFCLTFCSGPDGSTPQQNDCLLNEVVPCLTEDWSTWYFWLDEYGYNEYVISDGETFTYDGYLFFESDLLYVVLAGWVDDCQHGTVYTLWVMGTWYDVEGTLSICDDMLNLSALFIDEEQITDPK